MACKFAQVAKFRRRKETLFSDFQAEVAQQWGVAVQQQRWWLCKDRSNATIRVHRPIEPTEYSQRVSAILPTNQGAQHPQRDPHEKGLLLFLGELLFDLLWVVAKVRLACLDDA